MAGRPCHEIGHVALGSAQFASDLSGQSLSLTFCYIINNAHELIARRRKWKESADSAQTVRIRTARDV
jgi:hypothetical protein